MARSQQTALSATEREVSGSRAVRRLRRSGAVPGVVYGGGEEPLPFAVGERDLRHALADAGAVIDLTIGEGRPTPVVVKELARHPVSGETLHIDLLRVRLDEKIQTTVVLELLGADDAPGVKEGGVLEQITRELTVEALPTDIPDVLQHDVSGLETGATLTLAEISAPTNLTLVDDPETVVASITATRLQLEDENEIEQETEVVGEGETPPGEDTEAGSEAQAAEAAD